MNGRGSGSGGNNDLITLSPLLKTETPISCLQHCKKVKEKNKNA